MFRFVPLLLMIAGTRLVCADFPGLPILSDSLRSDVQRLSIIDREMSKLPQISLSGANASGFHSDYLNSESEPAAVEIDIFNPRLLDTIVLVPAVSEVNRKLKTAYGFPLKYRIEGRLADSPWQVIATGTNEGVSTAPVIHRIEPAEYQQLRIVPTKHWQRAEGLFVFAMSEFMAFGNGVNYALSARISPTSSIVSMPIWAHFHLCDGISILGMPVLGSTEPERFGFRSSPASEASPESPKWVQVDLGESKSIREVRLVPAAPPNEPRDDYGFPKEFNIEFCDDPNFPPEKVNSSPFSTKRRNIVGAAVLSVRTVGWPVHKARYIRVTATRMAGGDWIDGDFDNVSRTPRFRFALAELQAVEDAESPTNVALGCEASSSDGEQVENSNRWSLDALTDGYSCQGLLIPFPEFLEKHTERGQLEAERDLITDRIRDQQSSIRNVWMFIALGAIGLVACLALVMLMRQRRQASHKIHQLRQQIARDLHDEIGSSLATIRIASELAADITEADGATRTEFMQIRDQARDASHAMRDIVWLIDSDNASSHSVVKHLRGLAKTMLSGLNVGIQEDEQWSSVGIPIETRRSIVFAFKETLTNILKHAQASRVEIRLIVKNREFSFIVADDGVGFPTNSEIPVYSRSRIAAQLTEESATSEEAKGSAGNSATSTVENATDAAAATSSEIEQPNAFDTLTEIHHGLSNLVARAKDGDGHCELGVSKWDGAQVFWSIKIP